MDNFNTKRHWNKHRVMRDGEKKESAVIKRKMCLFIQSCLTLCDPMVGKLPSSSVPGDSPTRILECVAMPSSRVSSQPRDQTQVSHFAGGFFTESPGKPKEENSKRFYE